MNLLITSVGRRTKLVEYFKNEFKEYGQIIVTDCDNTASAMYFADKSYIVPMITDVNYIDKLIEICKKEDIEAIITLIDPELSLLADNIDKFQKIGVKLIVSNKEVTELCFDKYLMYKFLEKNGFNCAKTYIDLEEFIVDFNLKNIELPVFLKPRKGSASINANKINDIETLKAVFNCYPDMLIQEFLDGQEYGVDVYTDMVSQGIVSIFIKEKIKMRAGETDKAISIKDQRLIELINDFVNKLGTVGPIDIDVFKLKGEYYISEVNPRFGGGYLLAYECGNNFPKFILNNLKEQANTQEIGNYEEGIYMFKYENVIVKKDCDLIY